MPPTRGNKKVQQNFLKEMLEANQAAGSKMVPKVTSPKEPNNVAQTEEENDDNRIILPKIFSEFVDIVPSKFPDNVVFDPNYHCTTMSRVYFLDHSNLDKILDEHMKYVTEVTLPEREYTMEVMRSVISMPVRRMQAPYENFRFNSPVEEIIGRTVLINPRIKCYEDLQSFIKFQNEHRLMICEVSMYQNNQVHEDAKAYYEEKRKGLDRHAIPVVSTRRFQSRIKRKFYERDHLVEDVFLKDLTLQQLESKSNFKSVITKRMAAENVPEGSYEMFANIAILVINVIPFVLDSFTHFTMDPKYNLITNILTREEQDEVADSLEKFYMLTNANELRRKFSHKSTKEEFYNMYRMRSADDRKYLPYNHLYYDPNDDVEITEEQRKQILREITESLCNDNSAPSTSTQAEMNDSRQLASLQYKIVQRFVKNPGLTRTAEDYGNSSDTSRVTVLHQSSSLESIVEEPPVFPLPDRYLNHDVVPPQAAVALMKIMIPDKRFVFYVKQTLNLSYKKDFDSLWSQHKKFILINFFMEHWEDDAKKLFPVIDKLSKEVREKAQEMLLRLLEQQTTTSIQGEILIRKTVQRFVKNPELTRIAEEYGNSSDTSLESIVEEPPVFPLPDRYLNHDVVPPQAAVALMKIMIPDKRFVFYVKQTLNLSYKKDFDSLWSQHNKFILINFFMEHWEGDANKLFPVINKLSKETREKAQEMLLRLLEPQQTETLIQDKQQEEQEGTSASSVSQASDVMLISPRTPLKEISMDNVTQRRRFGPKGKRTPTIMLPSSDDSDPEKDATTFEGFENQVHENKKVGRSSDGHMHYLTVNHHGFGNC